MTQDWLTTKDLASYLQVTESTVKRLLTNNQIPHHNRLGSPRFFKSEIDDWMKSDVSKGADTSVEIPKFFYREKPILEYKLAASRVLIGQTPLSRLPKFIKKACNLMTESQKDHLMRQDFDPIMKNAYDYSRLSCQLGLIDNIRDGRTARYIPTGFAWQISNHNRIEASRETLKECIMDIVKKRKETIPQERHSIFLLWYYLKLKNEGIKASEEHFNRGNENNYYPIIRFHYSKGLCEYIFNKISSDEKEYFNMWDKICNRPK